MANEFVGCVRGAFGGNEGVTISGCSLVEVKMEACRQMEWKGGKHAVGCVAKGLDISLSSVGMFTGERCC